MTENKAAETRHGKRGLLALPCFGMPCFGNQNKAVEQGSATSLVLSWAEAGCGNKSCLANKSCFFAKRNKTCFAFFCIVAALFWQAPKQGKETRQTFSETRLVF